MARQAVAGGGRKRTFWPGAALVLLGLGVMGLVFYLGDTSEPAAQHVYFALGLTGMALLSLAGQATGVIGLVLLWHWRRSAAE